MILLSCIFNNTKSAKIQANSEQTEYFLNFGITGGGKGRLVGEITKGSPVRDKETRKRRRIGKSRTDFCRSKSQFPAGARRSPPPCATIAAQCCNLNGKLVKP